MGFSSAGKLCTTAGLAEPDMECSGGVFCATGTSSINEASACSVGFACPEGAVEPLPCPRGTFSTQDGLGSVLQCTKCRGGSYCDGKNPGAITGVCAPGFYCPEESTSRWQEVCPRGKVCSEGSASPADCPAGSSTFHDGAAKCTTCAPGTVCSGDLPKPCPKGSYCVSGREPQLCPAGTYMPQEGATKKDSCLPCPAGESTFSVDFVNYQYAR